ncbi:hypothetical protein NC653_015531 [Populus alba x Populus x berolinensis]|uniref:Uncharacterized protein n=1 Tax=Populus alba x Populus x berolinensis TaxID=444605 RepID=A0AAD6QKQ4_9ROSI|nr:hypothetical protein NC653_015531 [Populus alba x Populus x berolinensis]
MMTVQSLHFYVLIILFAYTPNMGNTTLSEFQVSLSLGWATSFFSVISAQGIGFPDYASLELKIANSLS